VKGKLLEAIMQMWTRDVKCSMFALWAKKVNETFNFTQNTKKFFDASIVIV